MPNDKSYFGLSFSLKFGLIGIISFFSYNSLAQSPEQDVSARFPPLSHQSAPVDNFKNGIEATPNGDLENLANFECGTYLVKGDFEGLQDGPYFLTLRRKSETPFTLIVLGGSTKEKLAFSKLKSTLEVYVPYPIKDSNEPVVFLQKFSTNKLPKQLDKQLIKRESCADRSKLHN